jgi:seryl-tRNA synthetase
LISGGKLLPDFTLTSLHNVIEYFRRNKMLDIKFVRENPEVVKQNIRNKFQDNKLELVDKVLELDKENREIKQEVEALRAERNKISKQIGALMAQGKKEEAEEVKKQVAASGTRIEELSTREKEVENFSKI